MLFVEVVDVEVFVKGGFALEVGGVQRVLLFKELNHLVVEGFVVFEVFVELGNEKVKYFLAVVELVDQLYLLLSLLGYSVTGEPVAFEP